jgi:site-specific recombinase
MEPELLRLDRALETYDSPFVTQNEELIAYIDAYPASGASRRDDQRRQAPARALRPVPGVIERIHKRAGRDGTSIRLTYHLQRLQQLMRRSEQLLDILEALREDPDGTSPRPPIVALFTHLIDEECQRNNLRRHWRNNTQLIALRVTDNASAHGEHYITETRAEYMTMARSAMIGGFIIAFMACLKILLVQGVDAAALGRPHLLPELRPRLLPDPHPARHRRDQAAGDDGQRHRRDDQPVGGKLRDIELLTGLIARTCAARSSPFSATSASPSRSPR